MARKKLLVVVVLLSGLLFVSFVFRAGLVNVNRLFSGSTGTSSTLSSSRPIMVNASKTIKDYAREPNYNEGKKFNVTVNIWNATDLFSWQINTTWNPSILDVSRIFAGEFLLRTTSPNKTASYQLHYVINATDNAKGYAGMAESILGAVAGINDNGALVSIEFLIKAYGWTDLTITLTGNLATTLLNSTGNSLTFTAANGYFSNKLLGDVDGNRTVNFADFGALIGSYGSKYGQPTYNRQADTNQDGAVNFSDFGDLIGNYGRKV